MSEPSPRRPPPPGAGRVRQPPPFRRRRPVIPPGPVCAVCLTPLHPLIADITDTHPCCDPHDTETKKERR